MLTEHELLQLSPLAQHFRERFKLTFPTLVHSEELRNCYELVVPAVHPDVGDLRVRDDVDELTISVGPHHWHVTLSHFDEQLHQLQLMLATNAAIDDVRAIVADETTFRVRRVNGRIANTMSYGPDYPRRLPLQPGDTEHRWSGPLLTDPHEAV